MRRTGPEPREQEEGRGSWRVPVRGRLRGGGGRGKGKGIESRRKERERGSGGLDDGLPAQGTASRDFADGEPLLFEVGQPAAGGVGQGGAVGVLRERGGGLEGAGRVADGRREIRPFKSLAAGELSLGDRSRFGCRSGTAGTVKRLPRGGGPGPGARSVAASASRAAPDAASADGPQRAGWPRRRVDSSAGEPAGTTADGA